MLSADYPDCCLNGILFHWIGKDKCFLRMQYSELRRIQCFNTFCPKSFHSQWNILSHPIHSAAKSKPPMPENNDPCVIVSRFFCYPDSLSFPLSKVVGICGQIPSVSSICHLQGGTFCHSPVWRWCLVGSIYVQGIGEWSLGKIMGELLSSPVGLEWEI